MRKSICILSFSTLKNDARVLRQIRNLVPHYDVTAVGLGPPHPEWKGMQDFTYHEVQPVPHRGFAKIHSRTLLAAARILPSLYHRWFWLRGHHQQALKFCTLKRHDAFHANDLSALPVAVKAAELNGGKVFFDAHEYSPLECEYDWLWRQTYKPFAYYMLKQLVPHIAASSTVCGPIAKKYKEEFGFEPFVITNSPERVDAPDHALDEKNIRLFHHGTAMRSRKLEIMIDMVALSDPRYSLTMMLLESGDPGYIPWLKSYAEQRAPGRVQILPPVPVAEIIGRVAEHDIGVFILEPNNFSFQMALPNKLFDFLMGGLAVLIGPSPAMVEIVEAHQCGWISPSFTAADAAAILNRISPAEITAARQRARAASRVLNAEAEMPKLIEAYRRLLNGSPS